MSWDNAVIFAGGRSSRMGQDKALLPFRGYDTLAEYQYRRLGKWFEHVYISAKDDKFPFEANVLRDKYTASSPMVALASSLEDVDEDEIFVISVDMPFVDEKIISKLFEQFYAHSDSEIVIASSTNGTEPLCGIYNKSVLDKTKALVLSDKHKLKDLLDVCRTYTMACDRDEVFANLNTIDEYNSYKEG
jgi:molybdopterin-guanine dinucleotide biosynthesis protein A